MNQSNDRELAERFARVLAEQSDRFKKQFATVRKKYPLVAGAFALLEAGIAGDEDNMWSYFVEILRGRTVFRPLRRIDLDPKLTAQKLAWECVKDGGEWTGGKCISKTLDRPPR